MKEEEVIIDGKNIKIVTELSEDLKDDSLLIDDLDNTLDLEKILEDTVKIEDLDG